MAEALQEQQLYEGIARLSRDLRDSAKLMGRAEVRFVVDLYYQIQEYRINIAGQFRNQTGVEPTALLQYLLANVSLLERQVPRAMQAYAEAHRPGRWALSIHGIGPVLAAGLLAHIDIAKAPTVGHIWRFAGLDPTLVWAKGAKRPFNARLKLLCWKIGQSFMKLRASKNDDYGLVYEARKRYELARNARGEHKGKQIRTSEGLKTVDELPPFIIDARARRYAVKLFLSHLHHVMYECEFGKPPPLPLILTHPALDPSGAPHTHFLAPPKWPQP